MDREKHYFECQCGDDPDTFILIFDEAHLGKDWQSSWEPELYLTTFLRDLPFFKRIWLAIKYIFGYKSKFGHFGETLIKYEDTNRLIGLIERYQSAYRNYQVDTEKFKG